MTSIKAQPKHEVAYHGSSRLADNLDKIKVLWDEDNWFIIEDRYWPSGKPTATLWHRCGTGKCKSSISNGRPMSGGEKCWRCDLEVPEKLSGFFNLVRYGQESMRND
jgi:hypothetical protein